MKSLQSKLKSAGIKPSHHRLKILEYMDGCCEHPTVEVMYKCLAKKLPTISKTTIYNTLKLFAEKGLVQELTIKGEEACYDASIKPHAHFMCAACSRVSDIEIPSKCPCITKDMSGYKVEGAHLYLTGLCKNCNKRGD